MGVRLDGPRELRFVGLAVVLLFIAVRNVFFFPDYEFLTDLYRFSPAYIKGLLGEDYE